MVWDHEVGIVAGESSSLADATSPSALSEQRHEELCLYVSNGCKQCICRRKRGHDRGHSYKHDSELPPEQRIEPTPAAPVELRDRLSGGKIAVVNDTPTPAALPASSPEAGRELDDKYFCATRLDDAQLGRHFCGRAKNHPGSHRDYMTGRTWESLSPPTEALG